MLTEKIDLSPSMKIVSCIFFIIGYRMKMSEMNNLYTECDLSTGFRRPRTRVLGSSVRGTGNVGVDMHGTAQFETITDYAIQVVTCHRQCHQCHHLSCQPRIEFFRGDNMSLPSENYGPDPYDINWNVPLHEATLESDRVKLTPFIPSLHARAYADMVNADPDLHRWFPFELSTLDDILVKIEFLIRRIPGCILFAIIDKARGDAFAGVVSLINTMPTQLRAEIAWLIVFPEFRRSYVADNAVGLLLNYCLELPDPPPGCRPGLGFRRVEWGGHAENRSSLTVSKRMGFKEECVSRWTWVLLERAEGNGIPIRDGDPMSTRPGRHTIVFSFCADDWESGGREHVQEMIDRQ